MPTTRNPYPAEFREQLVALARTRRSVLDCLNRARRITNFDESYLHRQKITENGAPVLDVRFLPSHTKVERFDVWWHGPDPQELDPVAGRGPFQMRGLLKQKNQERLLGAIGQKARMVWPIAIGRPSDPMARRAEGSDSARSTVGARSNRLWSKRTEGTKPGHRTLNPNWIDLL